MIAGSPWDEIKRVEQEGTANVDRIDTVLVELNGQLRALDARFTEYFEEREKESPGAESKSVQRRKAVQKKTASS